MMVLQLLQMDSLVLLGGVELRIVGHHAARRLLYILAGVLLGRVAGGRAVRRHHAGVLRVVVGRRAAGVQRRAAGPRGLALLVAGGQRIHELIRTHV